MWSKNRRLLAILTEEIVKQITYSFGGSVVAIPKGSKWIRDKRNQEIVSDRQSVLVNDKLVFKMSIPAIVKKYNMSRTAIHTILRLEKAKLKAQNN